MAEGPHPAPGHTAPAPTVRAGGTEGPCSVTTIRATGGRRGQHELTPSRVARSPPYRQGDRGSGGAADEKRARAFSADQPPEAEEQELEARPHLSTLLAGGPKASGSHPTSVGISATATTSRGHVIDPV